MSTLGAIEGCGSNILFLPVVASVTLEAAERGVELYTMEILLEGRGLVCSHFVVPYG